MREREREKRELHHPQSAPFYALPVQVAFTLSISPRQTARLEMPAARFLSFCARCEAAPLETGFHVGSKLPAQPVFSL